MLRKQFNSDLFNSIVEKNLIFNQIFNVNFYKLLRFNKNLNISLNLIKYEINNKY